MPSRSANRRLETVINSPLRLLTFPAVSTLCTWGPTVDASGKVIGDRSAQGLCSAIVESGSVRGRLESRTGTATVAERLRVSMCLRECFCETVSVWGHAEWETSILFGHTADSHSPYSQTLTFQNGLLDSDTPLKPHYPFTASSSIILPSVREHLAPPRFTWFSADKYICCSSPASVPISREHNIINIICTSRIHHKNTLISGQWKRKTDGEGDEKRRQEQSFFAFIEVNSVMHTAKRKIHPSFTVLLTHLLSFI